MTDWLALARSRRSSDECETSGTKATKATKVICEDSVEPPAEKPRTLPTISVPDSAQDWRDLYTERAAIAEHDGGLSRAEAERQAHECCIAAWLNQNPEPSNPDRCAWCGQEDETGHAIVPLGNNCRGHTWLHPDCWSSWYECRCAEAAHRLGDLGIGKPKSPSQTKSGARGAGAPYVHAAASVCTGAGA